MRSLFVFLEQLENPLIFRSDISAHEKLEAHLELRAWLQRKTPPKNIEKLLKGAFS